MRSSRTRLGKKWFATRLAVLLVRHQPVLTHRRTNPGNGQLPHRASAKRAAAPVEVHAQLRPLRVTAAECPRCLLRVAVRRSGAADLGGGEVVAMAVADQGG